MNHKRNMLIILLGLALIIGLALAWPTAPAQAGPALPPRNPVPSHPPPPEEDDDNDDGPGGAIVAASLPFNLPAEANQTLFISILLE